MKLEYCKILLLVVYMWYGEISTLVSVLEACHYGQELLVRGLRFLYLTQPVVIVFLQTLWLCFDNWSSLLIQFSHCLAYGYSICISGCHLIIISLQYLFIVTSHCKLSLPINKNIPEIKISWYVTK